LLSDLVDDADEEAVGVKFYLIKSSAVIMAMNAANRRSPTTPLMLAFNDGSKLRHAFSFAAAENTIFFLDDPFKSS
jgi:hypothetical protein